MWGKQVHVSKVVGNDTLVVEIKRRLQIKDLPSFLSETPSALYKIYNQGHWPSIIRELTTFMGKARDVAKKYDNLEEEYESRPIPPMTFRENSQNYQARTHHNSTTGPGKYRRIGRYFISS